MHELVKESSTGPDPASLGELSGVVLQLWYFGVISSHTPRAIEIILAELASQLLELPAADTKDWKAPGHLVIVSQVLVRIEGLIILLNRILLIEPADYQLRSPWVP